MSLAWALLWNVGTLYMMLRKNPTSVIHEGENIDACMRGGSSRSSDEVLVMRMERRGCVNPKRNVSNHKKWESMHISAWITLIGFSLKDQTRMR
jgi:hypothetical protein